MSGSQSLTKNRQLYFSNYTFSNNSNSTSEIEELENSSELFEINHEAFDREISMVSIKEEENYEGSLFSVDVNKWEDSVYVGVAGGKSNGDHQSSMEALVWTIKNCVSSSNTVVYLLHVFPETHHIPTPLGRLPRNQVSQKQVQSYMVQERSKRRDFLLKFIDTCSSAKVKVDTMLIESDMVAKAILDLIPILNIRKLVLGNTKSRKLRSKKGGGIIDQILQNAPEFCDVKIICEGKEVSYHIIGSPSPSPSPRNNDNGLKNDDYNSKTMQWEDQRDNPSSCTCFNKMFT